MSTEKNDSVAASLKRDRTESERVLVLGLGNILLKDEGIGVHVAGRLQKLDLPLNVEVVDGGTSGLDILLTQEQPYELIVVDAMKAGGKPGTIYKTKFTADETDRLTEVMNEQKQSKISLHEVSLVDALLVAQRVGCAPNEIVIIGIEPKEIDCGLETTAQVEQEIPEIINTVLEEIKDAVHTR